MSACPRCGTETLRFPIPADLRGYFPDDRPGIALCPRCFDVSPVDDPPTEMPDFQAEISDAFPREPDDAALLACILALADRPTLHRRDLAALLERAERDGIDVFLALDRLARAPGSEPYFDLSRRTRQLEQLLRD